MLSNMNQIEGQCRSHLTLGQVRIPVGWLQRIAVVIDVSDLLSAIPHVRHQVFEVVIVVVAAIIEKVQFRIGRSRF